MAFKVIKKDILSHNEEIADEVRESLDASGTLMVNIISSPGSGKTLFLEKAGPLLKEAGVPFAVLTGDCFTSRDAERLDLAGLPVVQINTGGACHINAELVQKSLEEVDLQNLDLVIVENVGNLVCPADFDIGEEFGEFLGAYDIALAPDGTYYIVDFENNRVTQMTTSMEPIMSFGDPGTGDGQFDTPTGIDIDDDGFIYIADAMNSRVQKFNASGGFIYSAGVNGSGDGQFYISFDVAVWGDYLYASDYVNGRIHVMNATDGAFISFIGSQGSGSGQLDYPAGLTFDKEGYLYVVDQENDRVQKFDTDGNYYLSQAIRVS